jgi:hypothetical protein
MHLLRFVGVLTAIVAFFAAVVAWPPLMVLLVAGVFLLAVWEETA